jgi:hypothetical protein
VAVFTVSDALGQLGRAEFNEWTATASQLPGQRLNSILDRSEVLWPAIDRDIGNGVDVLQGDAVSWGSNVLNYMQLVAKGDLGYLFASKDGKITFRDRNFANGATSLITFADGTATTGVPFSGISAETGADTLFGRVGVDREGGTLQTVTVASLSTWAATYGGVRSLSVTGLVLNTDAQSLALANYLLNLYSAPQYRVSSVTLDLHGFELGMQSQVLALEIGSTVTVSYSPNRTGPVITQTLVVQGIQHDIGPATHTVTLSTIQSPIQYFRLDDVVYGVLDDDRIGF